MTEKMATNVELPTLRSNERLLKQKRRSSGRYKDYGEMDNDLKTSPYNLLRLLNELPAISNKSAKSRTAGRLETPRTPMTSKTPLGDSDYYDRIPNHMKTPVHSRTPIKPVTPRSRPDTTDRKNKSKYNNSRKPSRNERRNELKSGRSYKVSSRYASVSDIDKIERPKSKSEKTSARYASVNNISSLDVPKSNKSDKTIHNKYIKLPPIHRPYTYNALKKHKEAAKDFLTLLKANYPRYTSSLEKSKNGTKSSSSKKGTPATRSNSLMSRSRSVSSVNEHISRQKFARLSLSRSRSVSDVNNGDKGRGRSRVKQTPLFTPRSTHTTARPQTRSKSVDAGRISRPRTREQPRTVRSRSTSIVESRKRDDKTEVGKRSFSTTRLLKSTKTKPPFEIRQTRASLARSQSLGVGTVSSKSKKAPPPSRSSRTRERSLSQLRRDRERSISRVRRTPSLPELHRSISRVSVASRADEPQKKKIAPLFIAIKPENQSSEKDKFMKNHNFTYSPQFRYANPPSENQLGRFSRASDKYLELAIKIMTNAIGIFGTYERYMEETGGRKLNRFEITQAAKAYLQRENLESEVDIHLSDDLLSRARMAVVGGRPTVIIRAVNMRENWVEGMLRHEIGTHYLRAWNNKLQKWGKTKTRQELALEPANPTEEGLASIHSVLFRKDPCLWRGALLYYTIYKASQMSFADVFNDLGQFVKDTEVRWEYCIRAKRGYTDTSQPGAFCKDQVYLNGALQILKHRDAIDFHMLVRCGKVSWRDLDKLEQLEPQLEQTRIPGFMMDMVTYKSELNRILERNGITQEDLLCI